MISVAVSWLTRVCKVKCLHVFNLHARACLNYCNVSMCVDECPRISLIFQCMWNACGIELVSLLVADLYRI